MIVSTHQEFLGPLAEGNFVRLQNTFTNVMENTRNFHSIYKIPCIPPSQSHLLLTLLANCP